jgi:DNA polymerase III sliding clamp (beta) subunit (PCNA family)
MKVHVDGTLLTKTLSRAALAKGSNLNPIHALVKIEAKVGKKNEPGTLTFSSTSGLMSMTTSIPAKVDLPGIVAVNTRDCLAASGAMPTGGIALTVTGTRVRLTGSSGRTWSGPVGDHTSLQPVPEPIDMAWARVPTDELNAALERVSYPTGSITEEERAWDGVRVEVFPNTLRTVGASRYQFAALDQTAAVGLKANTKSWIALVPTMAFPHLRELITEAAEAEQKFLDFHEDQKFIYIVGPSTLLVASMPIGEYPPWQFILQNFPTEPFCVLPRLALMESVKACLATSGRLDPGGVFQLVKGDVLLTKRNVDTDFSDKLSAPSMRPDLDVTFKVGLPYLLDCLKACDVDPECVLAGDGSSILLRTAGGYRGLVTLMQQNTEPPKS